MIPSFSTSRGMRVVVRTDSGDGPVLVDDVSLAASARRGAGPHRRIGAGKSTIGLATLGYTRAGCHIDRRQHRSSATRYPRDHARPSGARCAAPELAYIAQSAAASFNPAMTIMDQVCEVAVRQGLMIAPKPSRRPSLFRQLELPNPDTFGSRYPHQVSGGQLQRAMAAMAMVAKPDSSSSTSRPPRST